MGIQQEWESFIAHCDPDKQFHWTQTKEMRRCFFSGAFAFASLASQAGWKNSAVWELAKEAEKLCRQATAGDAEAN